MGFVRNYYRRYQEWRGEKLKFRAEVVWLLDEMLDNIPSVEIHRHGEWGCALKLYRYWGQEKFRAATPMQSGSTQNAADRGSTPLLPTEGEGNEAAR